jgi:hypothetical protein
VKVEWWHLALAAGAAGVLWRAAGAPGRAKVPPGDETIQLQVRPYALPDDFFHFAPVSWAGRQHPYPRQVGANVAPGLRSRQVPDWADCDR